jgi:hypothetical protein
MEVLLVFDQRLPRRHLVNWADPAAHEMGTGSVLPPVATRYC